MVNPRKYERYVYTTKQTARIVSLNQFDEVISFCNFRIPMVLKSKAKTPGEAYELIVRECIDFQTNFRKNSGYRRYIVGLCEMRLSEEKGKYCLEGKVIACKHQFKSTHQELDSQPI